MKKKIFISQPMNGKTDKQIKEDRENFMKNIIDFHFGNYEIIDSVLNLEENKSPIYYLSKSIELLDKADTVWFMRGWQKARGCRIEHEVAVAYGKECKYE